VAFLQLSPDHEGCTVRECLWWQSDRPPPEPPRWLCSSLRSQRGVSVQRPDAPGQPVWLEGEGLQSLSASSAELLIRLAVP